MKTILKFMTKESTLKVLTIVLALIAITYIEYLEFNRATVEVSDYMIQVIQSDNSTPFFQPSLSLNQ